MMDSLPLPPDSAILRRAFGQFATGVCILGLEGPEGERIAVTVNSFTSVSLQPALLLVCLGHSLRSHDAISRAAGFGISVLAEGQDALSTRFASRDSKSWDGITPQRGARGGLLIPGAVAQFDCVRADLVVAGDHSLLIGQILDCRTAPDLKPLIYFRGRYDAVASAA